MSTVLWQLSASPKASIGVIEGDQRQQLVRVTAAWKHADGRIIVLDGGRSSMSFYDSVGGYLYSVGRRGVGPGEFERLVSAWPYRADSIALFDFMRQRLSVFDGAGRFARSFGNPIRYERAPGMMPAESCCAITGSFTDGTLFGHAPDHIPVEVGPPRYGVASVFTVSADGAVASRIGAFESRLYSYDPSAPSHVRHYEGAYSFRYVAVGDTLFGSNGQTPALLAIRRAIPGVDTLRLPGEPKPFTGEVQAAFEHALREDYTLRGRRAYEGSLESNLPHQYAPTVPRFTALMSSRDGQLWLQQWTPRAGRHAAPVEFHVFSTAASQLATITFPAGSRLLWAGMGQVILLERDSLDVQYVRLYDVVAPLPLGR